MPSTSSKFVRVRSRCLAASLACLTGAVFSATAQVNVLTYHYDLARSGANTNETVLTPANVNSNSFGKLFAYSLDGQVFGEPLYVAGMEVPGQGTHNVVFAVTQHNSVYALDADSNAGPNDGLFWHMDLGTSCPTPNNDFGNRYGPYHDINPELGITSTPFIDLASGTMYLNSFTKEPGGGYAHRVHALNITNGQEQPYSPVVVSASVPGGGVDSVGGVVTFTASQHLQRPALTLVGGILYVAYSGVADTDPYHGWVLGFNPNTLQQLGGYIFNTTPNATKTQFGGNAGEGGFWMCGNGLAVDANTNLYAAVGNGSFNANLAGGTEYGDSVIRFSTSNQLAVADYFTPFNQATLATNDTDLGSGGVMLLPDSVGSATHPHLMVACGKEGRIYLLDRDNLGKYHSGDDSQIVQSMVKAVGGVFGSPAYFNGRIYYQGVGDVLKAFQITNGAINTTPVSKAAKSYGWPGGTPVISANGVNNAIVWAVQADAYVNSYPLQAGPSVLHAYVATNLAIELYNSSQATTRDQPGRAVKMVVPTVVNGKVYVGAQSSLAVYGNNTFALNPLLTPAAGSFNGSVTVNIAEPTPGATVYYTLDNSTPSDSSSVYTDSFVVTNSTAVKAIAYKAGMLPSGVTSATYLNTATNLTQGYVVQQFYSGAVRTDLESPTFNTAPTFTHYLNAFESPTGQSGSKYAERVYGYFTPAVTANYVFFVASDDDSDLFLSTDSTPQNKHLIARETVYSDSRQWLSSSGGSSLSSKRSDQFAGTAWPGGNTITLTAGVSYYLEADHAQGSGGDSFAATFKIAGNSDPANGDAPKLTGNLISSYTFASTYLTVLTQPQNTLRIQGNSVTLSVAAASGYLGDTTGSSLPPIQYQWQSAPAGLGVFTSLPNATNSSYTTPPLALSDDGTQFRVALNTIGAATTSANATLGVVRETIPPALVKIQSISAGGSSVIVAFSKSLDATSAQTAGNYVFSTGALSALSATLDGSGTNVTLATAGLPANTPITLAVAHVQDLDGNAVSPGTTISFSYSGTTVTNGAITPSPGLLNFTSIGTAAGQLVLQWTGSGTLQSAPAPNGPWTDADTQGNIQAVPVSTNVFYRLRQ